MSAISPGFQLGLALGLPMAALLLAVAAVATRPWWQGSNPLRLKRRGANVSAYRSRLAELDTEHEAGLVSAEDLAALQSELAARLLSEAQPEEAAAGGGGGRRWPAVLLATILLLIFAGGWYGLSGSWQAQRQLAAGAAQGEQVVAMVQQLAEKLQQQPDNPEGWAMLGRAYFVMQRFDESAKAYGEANTRAAQPDPEWLTGQGEALAFARDRDLQGTPAQLFERALAIAPDYGKALWYSGMAAAQGGDPATARRRWTALLAQPELPPEMRQVLQTHLQQLDGPLNGSATAGAAGGAAAQAATGPGLDLQISLAPEIAGKIPPDAVLFVFAKAEQGPPMPLAVQRLPGQTLPVEVHLDDRMAMAPALRLSAFDRYIVTARLSGSGGAQAQPGDLEGSLHVNRDQAGKPLRLLIDRLVR
jgi:cytochrome c-type biogenesis protein CcmH